MKLLIIGHTFPEPNTTAAGSRMMQLINMFQGAAYKITFATTASSSQWSANLKDSGVVTKNILLNDPTFDTFITELNPDIVLFDRYITEEQFGWRVGEICPSALRILDTEDLHFLRKARELAVNKGSGSNKVNLYSDLAKRELASILRSDISLIISEVEIDLLTETFRIAPETLCYLPFLIESPSEVEVDDFPKFQERNYFITVGNFQHKPNIDSVKWMQKEIWPLIRAAIPQAELHMYGAYAPQQILELHDSNSGFLLKGWIENIHFAMQNARVCLAPLRFGAGLKGKIFDAMMAGTPAVTTAIGAEGINGPWPFPGAISEKTEDIAKDSIDLYNNEALWVTAQDNGFTLLKERFNKDIHIDRFQQRLTDLNAKLQAHRAANYISQILQHKSLNANKYMSKWIEEKNKNTE